MKIKWVVEPAPTGRYRSFAHRNWPHGELDGEYAFKIRCEDNYTAKRARGEQPHAPLKVTVADRSKCAKGWDVRTLKGEFATLLEAKAAAQAFADKYPHIFKNIEA